MRRIPGTLFEVAVPHFFNFGGGIPEITAVNVQRIGYVNISADVDKFVNLLRDFFSNDTLKVGQGIYVHKPGFIEVPASPVSIHIQAESVVGIFEQSAPDSLKAGRVVGFCVGSRHPGNSLGTSCVGSFRESVNYILNLIDLRKRPWRFGIPDVLDGTICEKPFVIGISPFSRGRVNPVVVNAVNY